MLGLFKSTKTARKVTILVVDDDPSIRETIRDRLVARGWDVVMASDGQEALSIASESKPDVVLLDIHMPQMDGLTALECLRDDPELSDILVVMVTSSNSVPDITRAAACNVADYVTKPFNAVELVARVQEVLQKAKR
jgi:CheY-like chemotaxis protein